LKILSKAEKSLLLFLLNTFDIKEGIILTDDLKSEEKIDNKLIRYIPLWEWLLEETE
jgi:predicted AAA+ superfamily ATPase